MRTGNTYTLRTLTKPFLAWHGMTNGTAHIAPSKLFSAVEGRVEFNDNQQGHLLDCAKCKKVFAVFQTYISEATGARVKSRRQGSGIEGGMMQRFKEGEKVYVIGPIAENYFRAIGIVRAVTFTTGVYRYVVEFEDSRTNTFFGFELRLARKPAVTTQPEAT